jgi:hypothetical protein
MLAVCCWDCLVVEACFGCVGLVALGCVVVSRCMSLLDMLLVAAIDPISLLEVFVVFGFLLWPVAFGFMPVWFVCC